ncbi:MAG TPA: hypothetical protein VGN20_17980 [Mucilaginibacter sp.]
MFKLVLESDFEMIHDDNIFVAGKSLSKTQSRAELVSASHGTSGLLGVRLVYSLHGVYFAYEVLKSA